MTTRLDRLLHSIAPERMHDRIHRLIDEALNDFPRSKAVVHSGTEFRQTLLTAWRHVHARLWGTGPETLPVDAEFTWAQAQRILNSIYGGDNGWWVALDIARSGIKGGLYDVLRRFARKAAEQQQEQWIAMGVESLWHSMSYEDCVATVEEYLRTYEPLLPADVRSSCPIELVDRFPRLLREHPAILQQLRQLPRR